MGVGPNLKKKRGNQHRGSYNIGVILEGVRNPLPNMVLTFCYSEIHQLHVKITICVAKWKWTPPAMTLGGLVYIFQKNRLISTGI